MKDDVAWHQQLAKFVVDEGELYVCLFEVTGSIQSGYVSNNDNERVMENRIKMKFLHSNEDLF